MRAASWAIGLSMIVWGAMLFPNPRIAEAQDDFDSAFDAPAPAPEPAPAAAPSAPTAPAAAAPSAATAAVATDDGASGSASADPQTSEEDDIRWARLFRQSSSYFGSVGGIHVVDAGSAATGTFRIGLMTEFFKTTNWPVSGNNTRHVGGSLALSWSVHDMVEVYGSVQSYATRNSLSSPELIQVLGDAMVGVKVFQWLTPTIAFGGDVGFNFLNEVGDIGVFFSGISYDLGVNMTADLRGRPDPLPLFFRANLGWRFDQSWKLVEGVEDRRYDGLSGALPRDEEWRQYVTPMEQYALGISRVDYFDIGFGMGTPFEAGEDWYLTPLLEYVWNVPVNRGRNFNCVDASAIDPNATACLAGSGVNGHPMTITLGMQVAPPVRGLNITVAADIGVNGTGSPAYVELPANEPYQIIIGASYAYDPRVPEPEIIEREVPVEVEVEREPPRGRVRGVIVEQGTEDRIAGAVVTFSGRDLNPIVASSEGTFTSYAFEPGEVEMSVSHPSYLTGTCRAVIPSPPEAAGEGAEAGDGPAASSADEASGEHDPYAEAEAAASEAASEPTPSEGPTDGFDDEFGDFKQDGFDDEFAEGGAAPTSPVAETSDVNAGESADAPFVTNERGEIIVEVRCELEPSSRDGSLRGRVVSDAGIPVNAATVEITGTSSHSVQTNTAGSFSVDSLPAGTYTARVASDAYLIKIQEFTVPEREAADLNITLIGRPQRSLVSVRGRQIRIRRQVAFATSSAEILERSNELMAEIADVLMRNPNITLVEIQGHTDNRGSRRRNTELSQARADAVRDGLLQLGIEVSRLTTRGYGPSRPLVPNITPANRARNRRVQFLIKERSN